MTAAEGADAWQRILGQSHPQVAVSTQVLGDVMARNRAGRVLHLKEGVAQAEDGLRRLAPPSPQSSPAPRPELETAAPADPIFEAVAAVWRQVLGVDTVAPEDDFLEQNGDSLQAILVAARLRDRLGVRVTPNLIFEFPSAGALAAALARLEPAVSGPARPVFSGPAAAVADGLDALTGDALDAALEAVLAGAGP